MGYCINPMFLLVDNSDSPSLVEQLQQGHVPVAKLFGSCSWLYEVSYALCLSASLLQHGYILLCFCSYDLTFPMFFSSFFFSPHYYPSLSLLSSTTTLWDSAAPLFIQDVFSLNPGIACLTVHPGIACLTF